MSCYDWSGKNFIPSSSLSTPSSVSFAASSESSSLREGSSKQIPLAKSEVTRIDHFRTIASVGGDVLAQVRRR
jgi:hypothetical protein